MASSTTNSPQLPLSKIALLNLGFRPFFLGAAIFAIISIAIWMGVYAFQLPLQIEGISIFQWHAHEMIYGFAVAVIAGFLLTAVKNWTGIQTLHGSGLLGLFTLWAAARILFLFGTRFIILAAILDILFMLGLIAAVVYPVVKVKQWKQMGIMAKLALLAVGNSCFYLGAAGFIENGVYLGIYGGLYLIIGLMLTMGRRLIPFFVEVGVGYPVKLFNSQWLDLSSLVLFLAFFIVEVFIGNQQIAALLSVGLFVITSIRLTGWHTAGIWKRPLLWSLFTAFLFIDMGFLLMALHPFFNLSKLLAIHAFSFGGIGVATLSMMARVSLGHTGRDVKNPSVAVTVALAVLIVGGIFRVGLPLIAANHYLIWMLISQILWIAAFMIFVITYAAMLIKPRVDGQYG
ncbi:MAG: NnrS family protein [Candidatus Competibacter sp.]|nr:NnrS family protein [Candidatus Competibacter sp.]MDG4606690.1 NnrS family protein [Candidatus Contendobacter sp.]